VTVDYYNVKVESVIASLTSQGLVNACYDDPTGIDNQYCAAVFRRANTGDPLSDFTFRGQPNRNFAAFGGSNNYQLVGGNTDGPGFLLASFNFAKLTARGVDLEVAYRTRLSGETVFNTRAIVTRNLERENFTFQNEPARSTRLHGVLGDPLWAASLNSSLDFGAVDIRHSLRFVDKMTIGTFETQFSHQGRDPQVPDAFPVTHYPAAFYHGLRIGYEPEKRFRFYTGVDNLFNKQPPFGLDSTGAGGGIYPNTGRFFYAGAEVTF
jgi:outer membrane receptor protein involved in Fe transport